MISRALILFELYNSPLYISIILCNFWDVIVQYYPLIKISKTKNGMLALNKIQNHPNKLIAAASLQK